MSNDELLNSLTSIAANERQLVAKIVTYLIEVERRGLHLELAYSSMHDFYRRKLGLSEAEAYRRVAAARLVRRFPALIEAIESGRIHLTNMAILRDLFTDSNLESLIVGVGRFAVQFTASAELLLCRSHNLHEAKRVFGDAHIEKKIAERRQKRASDALDERQPSLYAEIEKVWSEAIERRVQNVLGEPAASNRGGPRGISERAFAQHARDE